MQNKKLYDYEEAIYLSYVELKKGYMALNDFLSDYHWDVQPTAKKAIKYGNTINPDKECSLDEKISYRLLTDYERMMWLVEVARDYCSNVCDTLNNALECKEVEPSKPDKEVSYENLSSNNSIVNLKTMICENIGKIDRTDILEYIHIIVKDIIEDEYNKTR